MKANLGLLWAAATSVLEPRNTALLRWHGRHINKEDGSTALDWPGTAFTVSVEGGSFLRASINASMARGAPVRLQVLLADGGTDEETWQQGNAYNPTLQWEVPLSPMQRYYTLASGLPQRATITVVLGNGPELWSESLKLVNLLTDGTFVAAKLPQTYFSRRIDFIGDSITAGSNMRRSEARANVNLVGDPECSSPALHSDFARSYASQLCMAFGASCSTQAINGKGLLTNCCDNGPRMPELYKRHLFHEESVIFPFEYPPHAVVINLGTNDYDGCRRLEGSDPCGQAFDQAFTARYVAFVQEIVKWYNTTDMQFFLAVGPISTAYHNATAAAVRNATALGLKVSLLQLRACIENCKGCFAHPDIEEHQRMFEMAYWPMKTILGW